VPEGGEPRDDPTPIPSAAHDAVMLADWLDGVAPLPAESIDLVYADPPFNTGDRQETPPGAEDAGRSARTAYADSWPSMEGYVDWLRKRVAATLPCLKPTANLMIHVDFRTSHHVRLLLDDLLGPDRFVNHLVWHYGLGGSSPRRFARKHDDILFYCLDPDRYWFEAPRVAATSQRLRGRTKKATDVLWMPEATQESTADVLDIASLNNMAKERTGYPTQKPVALLKLLIGACCPPGGTVLDPCCGSGTTLVAAAHLDRTALGFDINPDAVQLARERLAMSHRG
jgi:DNA modification methylase